MITVNRRTTVIGMFNNRLHAERALHELQALGFDTAQLGLSSPNTTVVRRTPLDHVESQTEEAAAYGAFAGACLAALWYVGAAWNVFPNWVPDFASPLANFIALVAGCAVMSGIIGALIGLATGDTEVRSDDIGSRSDQTCVSVKTSDGLRYNEASGILRRHGCCGPNNRRATDHSIAM